MTQRNPNNAAQADANSPLVVSKPGSIVCTDRDQFGREGGWVDGPFRVGVIYAQIPKLYIDTAQGSA